jgi:demethylmenaquinone methyltransferase/2-methoxy-6-polyprenyl-1,4-benzoquinol methylase
MKKREHKYQKQRKFFCEQVVPYASTDEKSEQITQMFDAISGNYDLMNRTMTFGVDKIWRKKAIDNLRDLSPKKILDVATGTGDFAIEAYRRLKPQYIIGIDLSKNMLAVGNEKIKKLGLSSKIFLQRGDCMQLVFADSEFDAVTVAFGVRNFTGLEQGCREMYRVLRPKGRLVILEMSEPYALVKPFYRIYTQYVIPFVARFFSKDKQAYQYLPDSIKAFPQGKVMIALLKDCGFSEVKLKRFLFGVCSLYVAEK